MSSTPFRVVYDCVVFLQGVGRRGNVSTGSTTARCNFLPCGPSVLDLWAAAEAINVLRQMDREEPWTQQDIAAEAFGDWLKKRGYL